MIFKAKELKWFLYWMQERHAIFMRRASGAKKPWTKDKILQSYKFTNVFRQLDRVSLELIKIIAAMKGQPLELIVANICAFRMFNLPETYQALVGPKHAWLTDWDEAHAKQVLHARAKAGKQVFTGAYIITNNGSTRPKIDLVCEAVSAIWKDASKITTYVRGNNSIQKAVDYMQGYPMVGGFIAYELVCDFCYVDKLLHNASDKLLWANPGPGAQRGINRLRFGKASIKKTGMTRPDYVDTMRKLYVVASAKLGKKFPPLVLRDIEHSLCEFDKYMRVKTGEGRPRSLYDGRGE